MEMKEQIKENTPDSENRAEMNKPSDFDEAVKAANMSSDRVLWIQALTQSGIKKSFVVELGSDEKQTPKK